jgi:hypothetical protein
VKTLRPNSLCLWYFGLCYCEKLGAGVSNGISLANKETPCIYLVAKIGSASGKIQLWSMIRLLRRVGIGTRGIGYKDKLGQLTSHRSAKRDISWPAKPASIIYDGSCPQLDAGTDCTCKVGAGNMI